MRRRRRIGIEGQLEVAESLARRLEAGEHPPIQRDSEGRDLRTRVTVVALVDPKSPEARAAHPFVERLTGLGPAAEFVAVAPGGESARVALERMETTLADVIVFLPSARPEDLEEIRALATPLLSGEGDACFGFRRRSERGGLVAQLAGALAWPLSQARDPLARFVAIRRERLSGVEIPPTIDLLGLAIARALPDSAKILEVPVPADGGGPAVETLRGVARLAGGTVPRGVAGRAALASLAIGLVDAALFAALRALDLPLSTAHSTSLGFALLALYVLGARFVFREEGGGAEQTTAGASRRWLPFSRRWLPFAAGSLLAISLRGALLEWLVVRAGTPITFALPLSFAVCVALMLFGSAFFVFGDRTRRSDGVLGAVTIIATAIGLHAVYLGLPQLLPDEAYHWTWSTHLALSYLDHPPLTAWLIRATTASFGESEFGVRLAAFAAGVVTIGFLYAAARDLYGKRAGLFTAALGAALPFYFSVSIVVMPDSWMFACWAIALWLATRALLYEQASAWWPLGLCIGIGCLSKYNMALFGAGLVVVVVLDSCLARESVRWLRRKEPYLAALLAGACLLPVLIWNYQNDWASFAFQTARRLERDRDRGFAVQWLFAHGALLLTPCVFVTALWSLLPGRAHLFAAAGLDPAGTNNPAAGPGPATDPSDQRKRRFLIVLTVVPLLPFVLFSITHQTRPHWTAAAWLSTLPMIGHAMASGSRAPNAVFRWMRRTITPTLVGLLVFYAVGLHYIVLGIPGIPYGNTFDRYYWKDAIPTLVRAEEELARVTGERPFIVGTSKWSIAAILSYYGPVDWQTRMGSRHFFGDPASMWDRWSSPAEAVGRPVLVVGRKRSELEDYEVTRTLEDAGPVVETILEREGVPLRPLYYRVALRYREPPPPGTDPRDKRRHNHRRETRREKGR